MSSLAIAGFYPSLHLNLAADYQKLGQLGDARDQISLARQRLSGLPDSEYGATIRAGIDRIEAELATSESTRG